MTLAENFSEMYLCMSIRPHYQLKFTHIYDVCKNTKNVETLDKMTSHYLRNFFSNQRDDFFSDCAERFFVSQICEYEEKHDNHSFENACEDVKLSAVYLNKVCTRVDKYLKEKLIFCNSRQAELTYKACNFLPENKKILYQRTIFVFTKSGQ